MPRSDQAFCLRLVLKSSTVVRSFCDAVSRFFDWRESLVVVRSETLLRWHRPGQFFAHVCEPSGDAYPRLMPADIHAALRYAADSLAHEEVVFSAAS